LRQFCVSWQGDTFCCRLGDWFFRERKQVELCCKICVLSSRTKLQTQVIFSYNG
jgi:hypothetical protein